MAGLIAKLHCWPKRRVEGVRVLQISVVHDAVPSVILSMVEEKALKANQDERSPHYGMGLQYMLNTDASRLSISYKEYVSSGIKVGDMVTVEITKLRKTAPEAVAKLLESRRPESY